MCYTDSILTRLLHLETQPLGSVLEDLLATDQLLHDTRQHYQHVKTNSCQLNCPMHAFCSLQMCKHMPYPSIHHHSHIVADECMVQDGSGRHKTSHKMSTHDWELPCLLRTNEIIAMSC